MKHSPSVMPFDAYLNAVRREIDETELLAGGNERERAAIQRSLTELAAVAAVENYLSTGGTAGVDGLAPLPGASRDEPDDSARLDGSRSASWRGQTYSATPSEIAELLEDANALLLGRPWERTQWRQPPDGDTSRRAEKIVRRTILLDPGDEADTHGDNRENALQRKEALRETPLFALTHVESRTTSELYRFNDDPDEESTDPDRGYTRVATGPLINELMDLLNTIICGSRPS